MVLENSVDLEVLPAYCQARVLILGVGNILFGDDGFGPAVIEALQGRFAIQDEMYVMDAGTGVRKILFTLLIGEVHPSEIVIVDAVDWGSKIGEVKIISPDDLPITKIDDFSLHQIPTSNMLRELQEHCQVKISIVVCDVGALSQEIKPGLTPETAEAVQTAALKIATQFVLDPL